MNTKGSRKAEGTLDRRDFLRGLTVTALTPVGGAVARTIRDRPNIVWIVAEDASPHLGCYGEKTIQTPNLDEMARTGVRFEQAFVTCPVCSPSRSAMITGVFQTTLGVHNHRSQTDEGKGGGNSDYLESYRLPVPLIPELLRKAGYCVTLGSGPSCSEPGKTDYNFVWSEFSYDGADWRECPDGKPFFAQIMLNGGKNREAKQHATDPSTVRLPPYYPEHPVLKEDWADYLNSWVQTDLEVGRILSSLTQAGVADNTVVFFWTDHGVSHLRGKQFLYEEGIHIPLIVRFPRRERVGQIRSDLVLQIDVAASSLALAGVPIPDNVQGRDLFSRGYVPRDAIFSARDRCDETVDIIRCVRTGRFKYIRNFLSHLPHAQWNQYKDGKRILQTLRGLSKTGQLNELQNRPFAPSRPVEELYDLEADPYETRSLAGDPRFRSVLKTLRKRLYDWMVEIRDLGLIPEPILEDLGKKYGNKYFILKQPQNRNLIRDLIEVIEAGENGNIKRLTEALESHDPSVRYWAATGLGNQGDPAAIQPLSGRMTDSGSAVRIAVALALCRLGRADDYARVLIREIPSRNLIAGMYAIRALELSGATGPEVENAVEVARESPYEFTRRIARRMFNRLH